jgi:hypothetical protein
MMIWTILVLLVVLNLHLILPIAICLFSSAWKKGVDGSEKVDTLGLVPDKGSICLLPIGRP